MARLLNILILVLFAAWILGMIFSAIFGLLIHILLIMAIAALIARLVIGVKRRKRQARSRTSGTTM